MMMMRMMAAGPVSEKKSDDSRAPVHDFDVLMDEKPAGVKRDVVKRPRKRTGSIPANAKAKAKAPTGLREAPGS